VDIRGNVVSGVVQFQKAGRRLRSRPTPDALVTELIDALHYLGGQAHRDVVVNCIAAIRRSAGQEIPDTLAEDLTAAFHEHLNAPGPCMMTLPFGPGSLRWALSNEGVAMLRHRIRML